LPRNRPAVEQIWQRRGPLAWLLLPLGILFFLLSALRRWLYQSGMLPAARLPVPVIVVGNITVGGAGKTPLTLWLVEALRGRGRRPGVVSRGYGGSANGVGEVRADSPAAEVGDEPVLIRRRGACPVFVGRDRVAAGMALLAAHPECDVIVCDDGLQHYRLGRDFEIAVLDRRGVWNGWPLPAGPLREPVSRLRSVDAVVANGWTGTAGYQMTLAGDRFRQLGRDRSCSPSDLAGLNLHAVAGIGDPQRFFDYLTGLGLRFQAHGFADHYRYVAADLAFDGDAILTTEKDAVKFGALAVLPVWVLPVTAAVAPDLGQFALEKIDGRPPA